MTKQNFELIDLNSDFQRFVEDLLLRKNAKHFFTEISPEDEMFANAILPGYKNEVNISFFRYIESALGMFDVYQQLVETYFGDFANVDKVLDFGSGYGRLTRSLTQHLPAKNIWVSDLYSDAMTWQEQVFGVNTVVSTKDPGQFPLDQSFSVVFVGSVFSHLPDELFQRWLRRLYDLTSPDGVLVFSVHDEKLLPATSRKRMIIWGRKRERIGKNGIRYFASSESDSLGTDIYGMTYVTEAYVRKSVEQLDPIRRVQYQRFPKALYQTQDIYVVAKKAIENPDFTIKIPPRGGFLAMFPDAGESIKFSGWTIDLNQGHQIIRFAVFCDSVRIQVSTNTTDYEEALHHYPGAPNMPLQWSFSLPAGMCQPRCLICVEFHSSCGSVGHVYATIPEGNIMPGFLKDLATC